MQYDAIWKDKRNLDWRDYVFSSIDKNVVTLRNGSKLPVFSFKYKNVKTEFLKKK